MINIYFGNILSIFFKEMDKYLSIQSPLEKYFSYETSEFSDEDRKYSVKTRGKLDYYEISVFSNKLLYDKYFYLLVNFD